MKKDDSRRLEKVIQKFLAKEGIQYAHDKKDGTYLFSVSLMEGTLRKVYYIIKIKKNSYTVNLISPIGVDIHHRKAMLTTFTYIGYINFGIKSGNFELNTNSGNIQFKYYVDCHGIIPSDKILKRSIHYPAKIFAKYSDRLTDIILGCYDIQDLPHTCASDPGNELEDESNGFAYTDDIAPPF